MSNETQKRDLVLPPGTYAFSQDVTKGIVKTYTGPTVINPTAQERPVVFNQASKQFENCSLEHSMQQIVIAPEGYYVILKNPSVRNDHPQSGGVFPSPDLEVGRKINITGPTSFALWPGQIGRLVRGHQLRSNQYLLVRVYNEEEARKNWSQAVVKPAEAAAGSASAAPTLDRPDHFAVGRQLIIRGDQVSFYIPPTGVEVVAEEGEYVRDALSLERLEYCILVDEDGTKRYERGPQVVFPEPTERFFEGHNDSGRPITKFRAIELNEIQGIHLKVTADYTENGKNYKAGDELFITGKDTAIYYPREEHATVKYDGKAKHFATAIPAGEGRYVMDRNTGAIRTVHGPAMLLPDPRSEVIVRRVLSDAECSFWYPGNEPVRLFNLAARELLSNVPTTRQGVISEGDLERGFRSLSLSNAGAEYGEKAKPRGQSKGLTASATSNAVHMDSSRVSRDQELVAEEFSRSSTYTTPRTITLDNRFGVPTISPWTGYAVLITSKTGGRRVETGPTTVLLNYDEALEILSLSTGKPKTTDRLLRTPYLRVDNNQISDIIEVETEDHVKIQLYLSYRVRFEGKTAEERQRWFAVENYVKFLCDHVRSILKGKLHGLKVQDFYARSLDILSDLILGAPVGEGGARPGMAFAENGMRIFSVEVLGVTLPETIRKLLEQAQHETVRSNIELAGAHRALEIARERDAITRETAQSQVDTQKATNALQRELAESQLALVLTKLDHAIRERAEQLKVREAEEASEDVKHGRQLTRAIRDQDVTFANRVREHELKLSQLRAETEAAIARLAAIDEGFSAALTTLSSNEAAVKIAQAMDTQKLIADESVADLLGRLFHSTSFKTVVEKVFNGNGAGKPLATSPTA